MKKIFFSLVAIAAIAACSKSEVQYEQTGEISFAPIASNATKSVAGYDYDDESTNFGNFDGIFPTTIDLYVFANAQADDLSANWPDPYFKNALFTYNEGKNKGLIQEINGEDVNVPGAYAGNPDSYYWPNVKSLVFAGVSKACNVNADSNPAVPSMSDGFRTLTVSNYIQDNSQDAEGVNDLMYFAWDGTSSFSKESAAGKEIPAQMKHACSWITIKVFGDEVTKGKWTLNSLCVKQISHSGTVACSTTGATWDNLGNVADEFYYNGSTTFGDAATEYATFAAASTDGEGNPTTTYQTTANNFIVIPQTPTSLDVTYTFVSQEAVGTEPAITLTETKNIPLKYTGEGQPNTEWLSGVHYIYNVKITATEILIDPVVVEWTPGASTNVTI